MLHLYDNRKNAISQNNAYLIEEIKQFSSKPLKTLVKENPSLLIFPNDIEESKDKIGDSVLFEINENFIQTSNLMGFFSVGKTAVSIHSRFDDNFDEESETNRDFFLHYMLSKVFFPNIVDLPHDSGNGNLNLLIFAFPCLLKNALSQGLYKEYETKNYNDSNVRGVININRNLKQNPVFTGRIAYKTREQAFDNSLTQLIRHTIEFIRSSNFSSILDYDSEVKNAVSKIVANTQTYEKSKRNEVVIKNVKPKLQPFYSKYFPLQKLCLQILRFDSSSFDIENEGLCGILFDGAWLWEEYLATILKNSGFSHPENKKHIGGIKMFETENLEDFFDKNFRRIYPDFYKENIVLDAKYKNLKNTLNREDIYQVISYMHILESKIGGFIYPLNEKNDEEKIYFNYKLKGEGGILKSIPFEIPQNSENMKDFISKINESENNFRNKITIQF